jgi:hypothetical protein
MATKKFHVKREPWGQRTRRAARAAEQNATRARRSDAEQLAVLDTRRGNSTRERERLAKRIVERAKNRTEEEIIEGGVAFITDTRLGGE